MMRSDVERRASRADVVDGVFFTFSAVAAIWFAFLLLGESVRFGWELLLLVVFWGFVAYLLLPRLHRILTRLYVPGYFIGRTRTADGCSATRSTWPCSAPSPRSTARWSRPAGSAPTTSTVAPPGG